MDLLTGLQGQTSDILHGTPKGMRYEETIKVLEDRFEDQHLATEYRYQLKTSPFALHEDHVRRGAGKSFVDGIGDSDMKWQLLLGQLKTANETYRHTPELAGMCPVRFPNTNARIFRKSRSPPQPKEETTASLCAGAVGARATFESTTSTNTMK
jgi:hypothetical protein